MFYLIIFVCIIIKSSSAQTKINALSHNHTHIPLFISNNFFWKMSDPSTRCWLSTERHRGNVVYCKRVQIFIGCISHTHSLSFSPATRRVFFLSSLESLDHSHWMCRLHYLRNVQRFFFDKNVQNRNEKKEKICKYDVTLALCHHFHSFWLASLTQIDDVGYVIHS